MNTPQSLSDSRPGPACAAFAPLLPLVAHHLLEPEEARTLQAHVADCAHCRARLAAYDRLDAALRRRFEQMAVSPPEIEDMLMKIETEGQEMPPTPAPPVRPRRGTRARRVIPWVSALAAVLLISLITAALVVSHLPPGNQASPITAPPGVYFSATTADGSNQTTIYALNPDTGHVRWHVKMPAGAMFFLTQVDHGVLYVLAQDTNTLANPSKDPTQDPPVGISVENAVYALRASDGKVLWRSQTGSAPYGMMLSDGVGYVSTADGTVYALNASNGSVKWHASAGGPAQLEQVADGVVYVATETTTPQGVGNGKLLAFSASDGAEKWHYAMPGGVSAVYAANGVVAVEDIEAAPDSATGNAIWNNHVVLLDASTGSVTWRYPGNAENVGDVFLLQDTLYIGVVGGTGKERSSIKLQAWNVSDGSLRWEKPYTRFYLLYPNQGAENGRVFLAANQTVFALNASDGSEVWHAQLGGTAGLYKLVNGILFANVLSEIYALNAEDGSMLWHYDMGNSTAFLTAGAQQVLWMAKNADPQQHWVFRLFALDARTGKPLWHYDATEAISEPIIG